MPARLLLAVPVLLLAVLVVALSGRADGATEGGLQRSIERQKQQERDLGDAAERLGRLESAAAKAVAGLEQRLATVQSELATAQIRLAGTQKRLKAARARATRLERRSDEARNALATLLRARYMGDPPDLVTVVLKADGFNALLEDLSFARRVQDRDEDLLQEIRVARREAIGQRATLDDLVPEQREEAAAVTRRRDAVATIRAAAERRRTVLAQARAARLALLDGVRADRQRSEATLSKLQRERRAAERRAALRALKSLEAESAASATKVGPGGPWAIPYAIVECESGGQNVPPNSATASGYYQFIDSTWAGLGGSTKHAYQAPKAEQDRLAARLWNNGAGAANWDCAAIVGLL
ncbi:MAG: transglycosylase family protein [Solirubrobacterales bacterium]|nr:transglycosylase family protein [Solirubrobacterales bacterium]